MTCQCETTLAQVEPHSPTIEGAIRSVIGLLHLTGLNETILP
jgi:hypothetical protein